MARLKNAPRRRRSPVLPEAAGGEDRLSSLPDALLRRVLSRLDTRTALSTAVLSRRWAHLPRDLPALRFSIEDVLPPLYFRALDRRCRARARGAAEDMDGKLLRYIKRCNQRAMRAFLDGIAGILDTPPCRQRAAKALSLEFYRTDGAGAGIIDRMIETAVGEWGVEHLDVVVVRSAPRDPPLPAYVFPDHLLDDERHRSRLRSLTLGHCVMPPLHRYAALERLVLQDTFACTPMHAYHAVFDGAAAAALRVVHLLCCRGASDVLEIDAPCSRVEAAPALERLHIHVAAGSSSPEGQPIYWEPRRKFRHRQLREVCVVGFANTPRQTRFLRYLVRVCELLERVVLCREGRVEEDELWGWKIVEQRQHANPWTLADWISVSAEIKQGTTWSKPHVELTLI